MGSPALSEGQGFDLEPSHGGFEVDDAAASSYVASPLQIRPDGDATSLGEAPAVPDPVENRDEDAVARLEGALAGLAVSEAQDPRSTAASKLSADCSGSASLVSDLEDDFFTSDERSGRVLHAGEMQSPVPSPSEIGIKDLTQLLSAPEDGDLGLREAQVAGVMFSSDSQLDEEVESFLRAEVEESGPAGDLSKISGVEQTGVVEAKWSDFKFSQNGSFSDFLYDLGGSQVDPQPSLHPAMQGSNSMWLGTGGSAADANSPLTLGQHFAAASKLEMTISSTSPYWEQTSTYTAVHEVKQVSPKGVARGADTRQEVAGGVHDELTVPGRVDVYNSGFGIASAVSFPADGGQQLETVQSHFDGQRFVNEYADPSLYYEDPEHPGWVYCYRTGQWLEKPVQQIDTHDLGTELGSDVRSSAAADNQDFSSSRQVGLAGASEAAKLASADPWDELHKEGSANFLAEAVSKDSDKATSPSSQAMSLISHQGEVGTSAVVGSSEATANVSGYMREGRGYDPNYPGWYYDYQSEQWCAEEVFQGPQATAAGGLGQSQQVADVMLTSDNHVAQDTAQDHRWYNKQTQTYSDFNAGLQGGSQEHYYGSGQQHQYMYNPLEAEQYPVLPQDQQAYHQGYPATGKLPQVELSTSYVADSEHHDAQRVAYSAQHLTYSGSQSQPGQPSAPMDHQGRQQLYAGGSYGQQTFIAKQDQHGQGAVHPMQGNMFPGKQGHGVAYQMAAEDQQGKFQNSIPLQRQYPSAGSVDSRSRMDPNALRLSGYNEPQAEPWLKNHSLSVAQSSYQAFQQGAGLHTGSTPFVSNGPTFGKEHVEGGWNNGYLGQPATSSHAQIYSQQYQQFAYQNQANHQAQQQINSGFSVYGQQWGFSASNPQYQQTQSWSPVVSVPKTTAEALRTSAGRPPHALCAFGFGGRIVVMKQRDPLRLQTTDGEQSIASGQAWTPSAVRLLNLFQLVSPSVESGHRAAGSLYFESLSRRTYNGPLVGGSVSNKELLKWIDEREKFCQEDVKNCKMDDLHRKNLESLSDLWGVLKIMCQHHGKLRSTVGTTGITLQEAEGPEIALANLLASGTPQNEWAMGISTLSASLQTTPSEQQLQKTAADMTKLLIAGKRKEALLQATEGQLWGPALLLAWQLGEKFYGETVIEMSRRLLHAGSPLRTLSLLLAGQPASEVFAGKGVTSPTTASPYSGALAGTGNSTQDAIHRMMEEWRSNLAIMSANRTNGDDRVMTYLGDCLMEMRQEVEAAHICYLVADSNFESFAHTARLCLLGANHRLYPRTYVTPEAIQRTELYEHAKVLGNPQFFLPQFQPYKLVYAHMLVEAGKKAEALRYCQAVLKMLKMAGRAPEVETCRQAAASLEERIKIHTNGGSNSVPKIFQGLTSILKTVDKGISGIIGGAPPPMTSESYPNGGVGNSGNILVPSDSSWQTSSVDPLNGLVNGNDRVNRPSRSASEPDFSKSPRSQATQEASQMQPAASKPPAKGGASNSVFARFGSNILQRAVFFVGKSPKEAKLGEKNKFYYDERLKRWVEEGAEAVAEEPALAPPPTAATFVSPMEDTPVNPPAGMSGSSGTPPVPPSGNQFSARSRQGVRSRYVDTLNKGGTSTPQKPTVSSLVPTARASPPPPQAMNFFVPAPVVSSNSDSADDPDTGQGNGDVTGSSGQPNGTGSYYSGGFESASSKEQGMPGQRSSHTVPVASSSMHRVGSVDNAVGFSGFHKADGEGRVADHSRTKSGGVAVANGSHTRAASWGGYPSSYQSVAEPSAAPHLCSPGLPATADYSMASSMLSNNNSSHSGSYFVPPSQIDLEPSVSASVSLPLPPAIETHRAAPMVNGLPLVHMGAMQNGHLAGVTLNAEEMQEVEL